jgi:hypothetical protein
MVIASVLAAHTTTVVLAWNKTTHVILKFAVVTHEILAAVALVAVHMVNADAPILAWSRYTLINVNTAHVPCNTKHNVKDFRMTFMSARLALNTMHYKTLTSTYGIKHKKLINSTCHETNFTLCRIIASRFSVSELQ